QPLEKPDELRTGELGRGSMQILVEHVRAEAPFVALNVRLGDEGGPLEIGDVAHRLSKRPEKPRLEKVVYRDVRIRLRGPERSAVRRQTLDRPHARNSRPVCPSPRNR